MINEIYVNGELVLNDNPKKQFRSGYKIRCVNCKDLIDRKWYDKKILETPYECKTCVLKYKNPMYNPEVKRAHKKALNNPIHVEYMSKLHSGKNNPFYGKTHTKEVKKKIIKANKKYWNSMSEDKRNEISKLYSEIQKKMLNDNPKDYRRKRAKAARISHIKQFENKKMNKIEKIVYEYVKSIEPNVEYSVILASYQFDFGIKDKKLLIEVDGDYWHGNPKLYNKDGSNGKRKLNEIQLEKIETDKEKTDWAESRGFKLLRIWEDEIKNGNFQNKIKGYIDEIKEN